MGLFQRDAALLDSGFRIPASSASIFCHLSFVIRFDCSGPPRDGLP